MEHWKKAAVGALAVVGLAAGVTTPADARVSVAIGIGAPWGHPSSCYDYWWDPVYVDGVWYQGPICWRWRHGVRVFFLHGRWHRHGWHGPLPRHWGWGRRGFVRWGWGHRPHGWRPGHHGGGHHGHGHGGHHGHGGG